MAPRRIRPSHTPLYRSASHWAQLHYRAFNAARKHIPMVLAVTFALERCDGRGEEMIIVCVVDGLRSLFR
jgi:hypothetical protein